MTCSSKLKRFIQAFHSHQEKLNCISGTPYTMSIMNLSCWWNFIKCVATMLLFMACSLCRSSCLQHFSCPLVAYYFSWIEFFLLIQWAWWVLHCSTQPMTLWVFFWPFMLIILFEWLITTLSLLQLLFFVELVFSENT